MASAGYTTHAVLLGFKDCDLATQTREIEATMRDKLGWKTCVYWIDGPDSSTAQERLNSIAYSLQSNIRHPDEQIVVYYGGYSSKREELDPTYDSLCGITLHADPYITKSFCADHGLFVRLDPLLSMLLVMPNDVLLLLDSRSDLCAGALKDWMIKRAFKPESRKRQIHVVAEDQHQKISLKAQHKTNCATPRCQRQAMWLSATSAGNGLSSIGQTLSWAASPHPTTIAQSPATMGNVSQGSVCGLSSTVILGERIYSMPPVVVPATHDPSIQSTSKYKAVNVFLMRWHIDIAECDFACKLLEDVFKTYYNYDVRLYTIPKEDDHHDQKWIGHDGMVGTDVYDMVETHGQADNLVIVYYCGHGGVRTQPNRLYGARSSDPASPKFDISRIQAYLRDRCAADVLLILDCCNAGFVPEYSDLTHHTYIEQHDHIMETMSACPSRSLAVGSGPHGFTRRLAGQLILHAGLKEPLTVDQLNSFLVHDWRYRKEGAKDADKSRENVRVLNGGKGSIVLAPLKWQAEGDGETMDL